MTSVYIKYPMRMLFTVLAGYTLQPVSKKVDNVINNMGLFRIIVLVLVGVSMFMDELNGENMMVIVMSAVLLHVLFELVNGVGV